MAKPPLGSGERFRSLSAKLKGKVRDPRAAAASIGRKKYGKEKFQKMAAKGKVHKAQDGAVIAGGVPKRPSSIDLMKQGYKGGNSNETII